MKMLLCTDIRLGALCTENLDIRLSHKWQAARTEKFAELMDLAARNHVAYIALFGSLFGRKRVSESVIDTLFAAVKEEKHIQVLTFLSAEEYNRINYRNDVPENLHLICTQTADSYTDDSIALRINKHTAEIQLADNDPVCIRKAEAGSYVLSLPAGQQIIPSFEPIGFEDAEGLFWGSGMVGNPNRPLFPGEKPKICVPGNGSEDPSQRRTKRDPPEDQHRYKKCCCGYVSQNHPCGQVCIRYHIEWRCPQDAAAKQDILR